MPADHDIFKEMNAAQWMWYFYNYAQDLDEDFTKTRNMIEYHASFIEPEGVKQVISSRENVVGSEAGEFDENVENIFGRTLPKSKTDGKIHSALPERNDPIMQPGKPKAEGKTTNYKDWIDLDLEQ